MFRFDFVIIAPTLSMQCLITN